MQRLLDIGFKKVGVWQCDKGVLVFSSSASLAATNVLYAFVDGKTVLYIGKTTKTLAKRMQGYCNPSSTQTTNFRNNANIKNLLSQKKSIKVYALADAGLLHYGAFNINLAAGLEDNLIKTFKPIWNCH